MSRVRPRGRSRAPRLLLTSLAAALALVLLGSLPVVAWSLIAPLQRGAALAPEARLEDLHGAGAIVLLSAGRRKAAPEYGGDIPDAVALERIRYAATLARRFDLPVLASGGLAEDGHPPLAEAMRRVLRQDYGIDAVWVEDRSRTTAENARFSAEMLKARGIRTVLLVTHAFHMPRAAASFLANGIAVVPAPTGFAAPPDRDIRAVLPNLNALRLTGYAAHEWLGRLWYDLALGY